MRNRSPAGQGFERLYDRNAITRIRERGDSNTPGSYDPSMAWEHLQVVHRAGSGPSTGRFSDEINRYLGSLGDEGWEMVSTAVFANGDLGLWFKRPKLGEPPPSAPDDENLRIGMYL